MENNGMIITALFFQQEFEVELYKLYVLYYKVELYSLYTILNIVFIFRTEWNGVKLVFLWFVSKSL